MSYDDQTVSTLDADPTLSAAAQRGGYIVLYEAEHEAERAAERDADKPPAHESLEADALPGAMGDERSGGASPALIVD